VKPADPSVQRLVESNGIHEAVEKHTNDGARQIVNISDDTLVMKPLEVSFTSRGLVYGGCMVVLKASSLLSNLGAHAHWPRAAHRSFLATGCYLLSAIAPF
jgi:hypothetical protein